MHLKLAILGSTRGTGMIAIIDAIKASVLPATIQIVVSNKKDALILERARHQNLPTLFIDPTNLSRDQYDLKLTECFLAHQVDVIVLVGYMRILSNEFIAKWRNKVINVHPSLLPAFSGLMDEQVHLAVLDSGVKESGCSVHVVTETVDSGPILMQKKCVVLSDDTLASLKARVQLLEGEALVEAIKKIAGEYQ